MSVCSDLHPSSGLDRIRVRVRLKVRGKLRARARLQVRVLEQVG